MINKKFIVAIDPDVDKSGVATIDVATKSIHSGLLTFPKLIDYLQELKIFPGLVVYVEAGWMVKKSNFHGQTGNKGQRVAKNVGANHETGRKIVEMAKHYGLEVREAHPLKKIWKGKEGKITQEEIEYFIPEFPKRSNQDLRDAALLAWHHAGFPIKAKTVKTIF